MSATGIGAAVRRKEDQRFITGKGHYTADMNRPGQTHAYFVRSPHAHAKIKNIDTKAAVAAPGVLAVLTGAELAADKIGNLICGWMIHSKDGSPMKMAPHPAIAHGKACHVGDAVAAVIAETLSQAKDAAEKVKVDYEVLPAVADPAKAQAKSTPQIHEVAPANTIYQWHLGDAKAADAAIKAAKHVTKLDFINNRLVPNAIEPRAAIGEYDHGTDNLHALEHHAESARRPPRHRRLRRHGARAQAARDRPRRRRRFRFQDFHLSRGSRLPVGVAKDWPAGQMGLRSLGSFRHRCARPRSRDPCRDGVRCRRQDHGVAREDHGQSRRLHVDVLVLGADLSLRHAALRPIRDSRDLLRGRRGLYQYRSGRCLSRRRPAGGDLRGRASGRGRCARVGHGSRRFAQEELHQEVPASDAGDHDV